MDIKEFNDFYLHPFLEKISNEKKNIFLMGDFNINLLNINIDNNVTEFFDIMASNLLIPFIINPTRVTPNSKTIIDNIFSDSQHHSDSISGNLHTHISDHYAQFLIIPFEKENTITSTDKYIRVIKHHNHEIINELQSVDWNKEIELSSKDINKSFFLFNNKINEVIDKHFPLKKCLLIKNIKKSNLG